MATLGQVTEIDTTIVLAVYPSSAPPAVHGALVLESQDLAYQRTLSHTETKTCQI